MTSDVVSTESDSSFADFFNQQIATPSEEVPQEEVAAAPEEVPQEEGDPVVPDEVPETPPAEEPQSEEPAQKLPDTQSFFIKDPVTGVREKHTVDWTKREDILKEISKARGLLPKLQSQRDQFKTKLEDVEPKYQKLQADLSQMTEAYKAEGAIGILKFLAEDEDELSAMLDGIYEERNASLNATAEELRERELAKLRKQQEDEQSRMKAELEDLRTRASKEEEARKLQQEEAEMQRVGSKWEFKLADSTLQEELNDMLWDRATAQMDRLAAQGVEITAAVKEAQFRLAKQSLSKFANAGAKQTGKKAVETAKSRAASQITAQVSGASDAQIDEAKLKEAAGASGGFSAFFNAVRGK